MPATESDGEVTGIQKVSDPSCEPGLRGLQITVGARDVASVIDGSRVHRRQVGKRAPHRGRAFCGTGAAAISADAFIAGESGERDARWREWTQLTYDLVPAKRFLVIDGINAPLPSFHQAIAPGEVVVRNAERAPLAIKLSAAVISGAK